MSWKGAPSTGSIDVILIHDRPYTDLFVSTTGAVLIHLHPLLAHIPIPLWSQPSYILAQ